MWCVRSVLYVTVFKKIPEQPLCIYWFNEHRIQQLWTCVAVAAEISSLMSPLTPNYIQQNKTYDVMSSHSKVLHLHKKQLMNWSTRITHTVISYHAACISELYGKGRGGRHSWDFWTWQPLCITIFGQIVVFLNLVTDSEKLPFL